MEDDKKEINLFDLLQEVTGIEDWEFADGPDSGVGVEYFMVSKDGSEAYIFIDQNYYTISVDGEVIASGDIYE